MGDPQPIALDDRYGDGPGWHDIQLEITGPAIGDLARTFRERWDDPTPLDHRNPLRARIASQPDLRLIALVPRFPERGGRFSGPPSSSATSRRSTSYAVWEATGSGLRPRKRRG
ncbi:MAG: hypothetical protein ACRD07_00230 [Acidimicrobiales bacterium]